MSTARENDTSVRLRVPRDWKRWSNAFIMQAQAHDVWEYIDPESIRPWPTKPKEPDLSTFPKRLTPRTTRASSSVRATITVGSHEPDEPIDQEGIPQSINEMTAIGRTNYKIEWDIYLARDKRYQLARSGFLGLIKYLQATVDPSLLEVYCDAKDNLRIWYKNLMAFGSEQTKTELMRLRENYKAATKPLTKIKNLGVWIETWDMAVSKARNGGVEDAKKTLKAGFLT
ncbi:hypothetical protein QBC38DRAFT_429248 [Podospora fimiseda]|uniref:Uncharacterized protein n=1 Tax=Podospora fimiseda TaxID=252190 RepID=A0AAN7BGH7_9PEZI|nr:hypothetical protein QBC38DRAFT_429248 [Podospora fimiseda]